jgi:carboxypeptidase C (cathepsin A)
MRRVSSLIPAIVLLLFGQVGFLATQAAVQEAPKEPQGTEAKPEQKTAPPPKEESSVTQHTIRIDGTTISYEATAATILLKDEKGKPTASMYYTAYTRPDLKDANRPVAFLYNGGPGSSSVWLHMGAFGPRRVVTLEAKATPPAPYKLEDNPSCLLDVSDLVFIDPVGTGFSKAEGEAKDKDFWGIDQDARSLAQFINSYVSRNNRWNSPKYLIGESYGTFRSAVLSDHLQSQEGMYLNGIVMISTVLDLGTLSFNTGVDMPYIFYLPSYAATAWYHKVLKDRPPDLDRFLVDARRFATTEYAHALMQGSKLGAAEKADIVTKLARFTGLNEDYLNKADLRVTLSQFMEELQRNRGLTTGRLDSRFSGPTYDLLGEHATYDPQSVAVAGAFTAAFNGYVREELKFGQDKNYRIMSEHAGREWDWKHAGGRGFGFPGSPNVEGDLIHAMITNTHLQVQVENGVYDLATPFLATEYTMEHLGLPAELQPNIRMNYYDAGHMMYLRPEDLAKLKNNIAGFIRKTSQP